MRLAANAGTPIVSLVMKVRSDILIQSHGKTLVVIGDRTAGEVRESAEAMGTFSRVLSYYFDTDTLDDFVSSLGVGSPAFIVGIAEPGLKREIAEALGSRGWEPATVVDPTAHIAPSAKLGRGCFIAPGAAISTNAVVGDHCIAHIHCSVGHDARVADYSAVLPGARLSGGVAVGANSIVGTNAFLGAGVAIGQDCRIDALAYVASDLPDRHIASPRLEKPIRRVV
ncbi:MAG: acetyltransferase [Aureliella sp.]